MFENLGERLQNVMDKIRGYGKITEENISDATSYLRSEKVSYKSYEEITSLETIFSLSIAKLIACLTLFSFIR